jgi:Protein of unknown function (DUF3592)
VLPSGIVVVVAGLQIALSIVGALALLFGAGIGAWRLSMWLGWRRRPATVTAYQHQRAYRGSGYRRITVRLRTDDGGDVEARDEGVWNRYAEGQQVTVLLVPSSDPLRVVVPEFLRFWMMSLIFIPFGAVFLYAGLVYVPNRG